MDLPPEIRVHIFELVCGSKMVHINRLRPKRHIWKFRRVQNVCRALRSENESHRNLMGFGIMSEPQRGETKHDNCQTNGEPAFDFGLLRVNKRIYQEAQFLAVQTTTFSFTERWNRENDGFCVIRDFVTNMPQEQLIQIRKARLDMEMTNATFEAAWKQTIEGHVLPKMPNIHHLYVNLNVGAALCWTQRYENDDHVQELDWMKPVLALRQLPLQTVRVIIADAKRNPAASTILSAQVGMRCHQKYCLGADAHEAGRRKSYKLRRNVKQRYAEYIRKKLLSRE